jgi:chaperonin GroES
MRAQGTAVLILPDKLPERTPSGRLVIPRTAKDLPQTGTVIEAGPVCEQVKAGNRVHFGRKSASVEVIDDKDHYWVQEDKIFYIE